MKGKEPSKDKLQFLILDPERGWQKFPAQRVVPMLDGAYRVPEYAGCATKFVTAYLYQSKAGRLILRRIECTELTFESNGFLDQSTLYSGILKKMVAANQTEKLIPAGTSANFLALPPAQIDKICEVLGADRQ